VSGGFISSGAGPARGLLLELSFHGRTEVSAEAVRIALAQVCVDDRLDHARIRAQIHEKMRSIYLRADRIFILNEVGGNLGQNFRNTLEVFRASGAEVTFCAILHHDDCAAAAMGRRLPMEQTVAELSGCLAKGGVTCPVYTGHVRTRDSSVAWGGEPGQELPAAA
jgi:hypothetical protein